MDLRTKEEVETFLAKCKPSPLPKEETARRIRLQLLGMTEFAHKAAEEKMPGFGALLAATMAKLAKLEAELEAA